MNLSNAIKVTRHSNAVAAGSSNETPSGDIDMQNFESCIFQVSFGAIVSGAATSIEVHTSSDAGVADSYTALLGTKVTVADTDDNKIAQVEVSKNLERYIKCVVNRATQNSTIDGITALQYGARVLPTTNDSSTVIANEIHVSPAEGTA